MEKEENESKKKIIEKELREVIERHGLYHCAFCGSYNNDEYLGLFLCKEKMPDIFQTVLNVGRLWQVGRNITRDMLNKFEKVWGDK